MPCFGGGSACAPSLWGGIVTNWGWVLPEGSALLPAPPAFLGAAPHVQGTTQHQGWLIPSHGCDLQGPQHTLWHECPWFHVLRH